jgi:hypothetical protein
MNQNHGKTRHCGTLLIAILLLLLGALAAESQEVVTLEGEIEPAEYDDESGELISVAIYDPKWGSVLVSPEGKGRELLDHVGAIVTATGTIMELSDDSGFEYVIKVSSYTIREPEEFPEEEPDWDPDERR